MFGKLVLLLVIVLALEIVLLVQLGNWIGLGWTLVLLVVAGFVGASLVRRESLRVLTEVRGQLEARRAPTDAMLDVLLVLLAAGALIMPGVLSDLVGFALLLPPVRARLKPALRKRFRWAREGAQIHVRGPGGPRRSPPGQVIDVDPDPPDGPR